MNWSGDLYAVAFTGLAIVCSAVAVRVLRASPSKRNWGVVGGSGLLLIALVFGGIGIPALLPPAEPPPWEQPQNEQERRAYEFAHSIVLPDSIPKPVPFSFARARLLALIPGMPSVAVQYHKHLCETEAGQFVLRPVENVDGFFQLRPRRSRTDEELRERFEIESPLGIYTDAGEWFASGATPATSRGGPIAFVQPLQGRYLWLEQPATTGLGVTRFHRRRSHATDPSQALNYTTSRGDGVTVRVPYLIEGVASEASVARYGYTYRGIRRQEDRSHWIAGC